MYNYVSILLSKYLYYVVISWARKNYNKLKYSSRDKIIENYIEIM